MMLKRILIGIAFVLLACVPLVFSSYNVGLMGQFLALALVAMSISISWGIGGMLSLGQGLFFGLGGYALAMHLKLVATPKGELPDFMFYNGLEHMPWWWEPFTNPVFAMCAVVILPTLFAAFLGMVVFKRRITGVYVSLITQALVLAFVTLLNGAQPYTSGTNGITDYHTFLGIDLRTPEFRNQLYFATLVLVVLCYLGAKAFLKSHFGKVLLAIRDNENRVRFLGYDPSDYKIVAFAFSGMLAGISGALYALHKGTISPQMIDTSHSILFVVWVALAGRESLGGAILGAVLVNFLQDKISTLFPEGWLYVMGGLFVLVAVYMPKGIIGTLEPLLSKVFKPKLSPRVELQQEQA